MNSNINLRALEPEDASFMHEAEKDEAAWKYSDYLAPLSFDMLREYALTYDADPFRSGQLRLVAEADGKAVGLIDLFDISPRHLHADTGIFLVPDARGKRIGSEALGMLCRYCRSRLGLHMLKATISEFNTVALGAYRKAGFTLAGRLPDWFRNEDGYEDMLILTKTL